MEFSYGDGQFREGKSVFKGEIILGEYKLYLRKDRQEIPQTFVPVEKIDLIRFRGRTLSVSFRPNTVEHYVIVLRGEGKLIRELLKDIVNRRGLKKRFWKNEWYEVKD